MSDNVTLHVFVASDQGKIKPHGYYQACKVTGRNTTPCKEIDVDGTTVIEIPWECAGKMEMRYYLCLGGNVDSCHHQRGQGSYI